MQSARAAQSGARETQAPRKSTSHKRGTQRKSGTRLHIKLLQDPGRNFLPVKSGWYYTRIVVKTEVTKDKKTKMDRKKKVISIFLTDEGVPL